MILYRLFDADGALLYVGITNDWKRRRAAHSRSKPWWPQVASETYREFQTRAAAVRAESRAISREQPKHNVDGKWPRSRNHGQMSRGLPCNQMAKGSVYYPPVTTTAAPPAPTAGSTP